MAGLATDLMQVPVAALVPMVNMTSTGTCIRSVANPAIRPYWQSANRCSMTEVFSLDVA